MEASDRLRRALIDSGLTGGTRPAGTRPIRSIPEPAFQHALSAMPASEQGVEAFLPGFWQDTPTGRVFIVEQRFDLDHLHGKYPLGQTLTVAASLLARIGREPALAGVDHDRILYLDTETTGLAGGTGTVAFLVGIGHFLDGGFRLRQYFLDSLDSEDALLRALSDYLDPFDAVVTYNGKAFDLPLLETRFILNRQRRDVRALPHLDLLFATRRLFRDRFASCRLGEIERQVLGLMRHEDVPSFEIPSLYFRYVRQRRFRPLVPVFAHNALDVLSMVTLTAHLGSLYGTHEDLTSLDKLALARVHERDGYHEEAIAHYRDALAAGLPSVPRDDAERRLSLLYKRLGRWDDAVSLWFQIAYRPDNCSLSPLIELAAYCERQRRDFAAALVHAEHALGLLRRHHLRLGAKGARDEEARIERRLQRLRLRLERPAKRGRASVLDSATPPDLDLHGTLHPLILSLSKEAGSTIQVC